MSGVVIGMDPHKRSATIEIINDREQILGQGRFTADTPSVITASAEDTLAVSPVAG